jgi:hypothetical protein
MVVVKDDSVLRMTIECLFVLHLGFTVEESGPTMGIAMT